MSEWWRERRAAWRERRAASNRVVAKWGTALIVFQLLAVAIGIALLSILIEGELSWPVILGGTLGVLIFIWSSRRNARFERSLERDRGED